MKEDILKMIRLAWIDGLGCHHNTKTQKQYDQDWENFLDMIEGDIDKVLNPPADWVHCDYCGSTWNRSIVTGCSKGCPVKKEEG